MVGAEFGPADTCPGPRTLRQPPRQQRHHRHRREGGVHFRTATVISCSDNLRVAGRASSTVGGALRIDIRRLTIPVLPLKQQQAYGDAFRRLAAFRTTLDHAAEIGAALAREISDALTTGTLELSP